MNPFEPASSGPSSALRLKYPRFALILGSYHPPQGLSSDTAASEVRFAGSEGGQKKVVNEVEKRGKKWKHNAPTE